MGSCTLESPSHFVRVLFGDVLPRPLLCSGEVWVRRGCHKAPHVSPCQCVSAVTNTTTKMASLLCTVCRRMDHGASMRFLVTAQTRPLEVAETIDNMASGGAQVIHINMTLGNKAQSSTQTPVTAGSWTQIRSSAAAWSRTSPQETRYALTSIWLPAAAARHTDIYMASGCSTDHAHPHVLSGHKCHRGQPGPQQDTACWASFYN